MKKCSCCKELKDESEFHKNKSCKDGLHSGCKKCNSQLNKEYRQKNRERFKQYNKEHYLKNREKEIKYAKKWNREHKEHRQKYGLKYHQKYYPINKIRILQRQKEYRQIRNQAGLCSCCGQNIIDFSRSSCECENCLNKTNISTKKRIKKLLSLGLCIWCGKQPIAFSRSKRHCNNCRDKLTYNWMKRNGYNPDFEHELILASNSLKEELKNYGSL